MAEEKRSVEISYKADIKDLVTQLKKLPNVTEQEAKKMVSALDRQLKQAERAAKRQAEATKKAASASSRAAKAGSRDFKDLADSADRASERLKRVGESSGDIDRGFSGIGLALREVNPQLATAADSLADTFAVVESLTVGFGALNPVVLAGAAAIGALTLGYMSYQAEMEKTREIVLAVREAQKQLNQETKDQTANIADALNKVEAINDQYKLLTGEITEYEFAINEAGRAAAEALQPNIDAQREIITQREKDLVLVQKLFKANQALGVQAVILSDEEQARLQTLQLQNDSIDNRVKLTDKGAKVAGELAQLEKIIESDLNRQNVILGGLEDKRLQAVDQARQIAEYEQENAQAAQTVTVAVQEQIDTRNYLLELQQKHEDATLTGIAKEANLIKRKYEEEFELIELLREKTGEDQLAEETRIATLKQKRNELHDLILKNQEIEEKKQQDGFKAILASTEEFTKASEQLLANLGIENSKVAKRLFRMQQASALGNIGMKTAEAITAAMVFPPPLNAILAAGAATTGAVQAAAVLSEQPPQYHMGGMMTGETPATLLKGEAVLDRATVNRLGGEEGVRQLQNNTNQPEQNVNISLNYKHFGMMMRDRQKRQSKRVGSRGF